MSKDRIRILVAEDDPHIRAGLVDALESEGYEAVAARDGGEALRLFGQRRFDLALLDVMMPEKSGYDVCREIRRAGHALPVIMVTAKGEEIDKVVGLELGADDYITKPFGVRELLARVAAVLRRSRAAAAPPAPASAALPDVFAFGPAAIDRKKMRAVRGRQAIDLTARELKLLETFAAHPDEALSRDMLLNAAWGIDYLGTTRTLDQHIAQLRKKVERNPAEPEAILKVHGVGYRYCPPQKT
jgi:DNA-binding response OmpR family regulator